MTLEVIKKQGLYRTRKVVREHWLWHNYDGEYIYWSWNHNRWMFVRGTGSVEELSAKNQLGALYGH